jgi:hypothetical protein
MDYYKCKTVRCSNNILLCFYTFKKCANFYYAFYMYMSTTYHVDMMQNAILIISKNSGKTGHKVVIIQDKLKSLFCALVLNLSLL